MSDFKRIVFAADFSEASERALDYALMIANHHKAELHLLHIKVSLHPKYLTVDFTGITDRIESAQHEYAEKQLQKMVPKTQGNVTIAIERHNKAAPAISDYAERHGADLIVVGSHGYSGLDRIFLGSEAQSLVRIASVPVLVVRPDSTLPQGGAAPFTRILAPVDLSSASADMLHRADDLAQAYSAKLLVMHSLDVVVPTYYSVAPSIAQIPQANQALASFLSDMHLNTETKEIVTLAPAAIAIVETANTHSADLIVMSRTGLSGWQRFLIGSVTERVLHSAPCPVLVIPVAQESSSGEPL